MRFARRQLPFLVSKTIVCVGDGGKCIAETGKCDLEGGGWAATGATVTQLRAHCTVPHMAVWWRTQIAELEAALEQAARQLVVLTAEVEQAKKQQAKTPP